MSRRGPGSGVGAEDFKAAEPFLELLGQPQSVRLWRRRFGAITPQQLVAIMRRDMPPGLRMTINFRDDGDVDWTSKIERRLSHGRRVDVLDADRTIKPATSDVTHDRLMIDDKAQGKGLGRIFLANSMDVYKALGLKKINVWAASTAGGYVWARFGFVPLQADWDELRADLQIHLRGMEQQIPADQLDVVKRILKSRTPKTIWLLADLRHKVDGKPLGRELLAGRRWNGTFDLTDPGATARFDAYVRSEPKVAARPGDAPPPAKPPKPPKPPRHA